MDPAGRSELAAGRGAGGTLVIDPFPWQPDELPELARQRLEHCPPELRVVIGPNVRTSEAPKDVLIPDLAVVEANQFRLTATSVPCSAAVLVIEVLSPSTWRKDTYVKAPVHATLGIGHSWTVDPRRGAAELHQERSRDTIRRPADGPRPRSATRRRASFSPCLF